MKGLLQIIKWAASDVYETKKPCDWLVATVESVSPVTINTGQYQLSEALLVFVEGMRQKLQKGDRVILLRKSGGQKYLVIGRSE